MLKSKAVIFYANIILTLLYTALIFSFANYKYLVSKHSIIQLADPEIIILFYNPITR